MVKQTAVGGGFGATRIAWDTALQEPRRFYTLSTRNDTLSGAFHPDSLQVSQFRRHVGKTDGPDKLQAMTSRPLRHDFSVMDDAI